MLPFTYRIDQFYRFGPCLVQFVDVDIAVHIGGRQEVSATVVIHE